MQGYQKNTIIAVFEDYAGIDDYPYCTFTEDAFRKLSAEEKDLILMLYGNIFVVYKNKIRGLKADLIVMDEFGEFNGTDDSLRNFVYKG